MSDDLSPRVPPTRKVDSEQLAAVYLDVMRADYEAGIPWEPSWPLFNPVQNYTTTTPAPSAYDG